MKTRTRISLVISLIVLIVALGVSAQSGSNKAQSETKAPASKAIAKTAFGMVQGIETTDKNYTGVVEFRGIPYAAPPVGDLRWKAPVDPKKWEGVMVCNTYKPMPMQVLGGATQDPYKDDFYYKGVPEMSEDCLYLNITTTGDSLGGEGKKPVYVWFHGGGLSSCYIYEPENNGEAFAKNGVVLVMVEQRLGLFGYLSLPQLTREQGQSGNYGLMDQVKALQWIKANIASFGGDPNNITCGGQSGGTTKSMALAISPKNDVTIKRLILESGLKWTVDKYQTQAEAEQRGQAFIKDLGLAADTALESLRKLDPKALMKGGGRNTPGSMNQDGLYVTYPSVFDAANAGRLDNIAILSGTNLGEGTYPNTPTAAIFYEKYKEALGALYDKYDFKNLVKVSDISAQQVSRTLGTYGLGTTGSRALMVNRVYGKLMSERTNGKIKNYTYLFNHLLPESVSDLGTERAAATQWVYHSSDMWYAFNSLRPGIPPIRNWTAWDYDLAKQINQYWTNFLKTGDPNGKGLVKWPVADGGMGYVILGDGITSHTGPLTRLEQLMQEYTANYYKAPVGF